MSSDVVPVPSPGTGHAALSRSQVREVVAEAVGSVAGLSLLVPLRKEALRLAGRDEGMAVSVSDDLVEVRVVAHRLPLPPMLDRAGDLARAGLAGTRWSEVPVRFVVAELARSAFDDR